MNSGRDKCCAQVSLGTTASLPVQVLGMQWNMLQGRIPPSWANLSSLRAVWVRPGNYQLCGSTPALAPFHLCKEVDTRCAFRLLAFLTHCNESPGGHAMQSESTLQTHLKAWA